MGRKNPFSFLIIFKVFVLTGNFTIPIEGNSVELPCSLPCSCEKSFKGQVKKKLNQSICQWMQLSKHWINIAAAQGKVLKASDAGAPESVKLTC